MHTSDTVCCWSRSHDFTNLNKEKIRRNEKVPKYPYIKDKNMNREGHQKGGSMIVRPVIGAQKQICNYCIWLGQIW